MYTLGPESGSRCNGLHNIKDQARTEAYSQDHLSSAGRYFTLYGPDSVRAKTASQVLIRFGSNLGVIQASLRGFFLPAPPPPLCGSNSFPGSRVASAEG